MGVQCIAGCEVEPELDLRLDLVDVLPARTRRPGEPLGEQRSWNDQPLVDAQIVRNGLGSSCKSPHEGGLLAETERDV
jgi:hypothetical protein